jgi:hypothetical protein
MNEPTPDIAVPDDVQLGGIDDEHSAAVFAVI